MTPRRGQSTPATSRHPRHAPDLRPTDPGAAGRIVRDFLGVLRNQFYPDDAKPFYQQRWMLIRAITYPASYLALRGVGLTEADHRSILTGQIRAIQHHGDTRAIRFFGRYFLHVIQQHMKFHGEDYYDSGKTIRALAAAGLGSIKAKAAAQALDTTERLAEISAAIRPPARRKKAACKQPEQLEFL